MNPSYSNALLRILFFSVLLFSSAFIHGQEVLNRKDQYILIKGEKPLERKGFVWRTANNNRVCIGEIRTVAKRGKVTAAKIMYEDLTIKKGDSVSILSQKDSESKFSKYLINILRTGSDSPSLDGVYVKDDLIKYIFTNDNMIVLKNGSMYKVSETFSQDIRDWKMGDRVIMIDGEEIINSDREFVAVKVTLIE